MKRDDRSAGTVAVLFSFLCACAIWFLVTSILESPFQGSSGFDGVSFDVRVLLLIPIVPAAVIAAGVSTRGGKRGGALGFGALAVTLLAVLVLRTH
jgi:uncharacterized membrane protein